MKTLREYIDIIREAEQPVNANMDRAVELYLQFKNKYANEIGSNGDNLLDGIIQARHNTGVPTDGITPQDIEATITLAVRDPELASMIAQQGIKDEFGVFDLLADEYGWEPLDAVEAYLDVDAVSVQADMDYWKLQEQLESLGIEPWDAMVQASKTQQA